ncbi:hypothetical protein [Leptospirillum ferriphilum]|uniref:hypothetical protein n=1 Tax=Leptospirillum ferriphilum TaxID=178606 RepID=UPI00193A8CCF|nr:hypothetical protein [Leptospirillum ferriphilum]
MGRRYSFDVLRARILFVRHGAHKMKPFRRPKEKEFELGYGLPSTENGSEEISLGVDTSTLLNLIEKGEI